MEHRIKQFLPWLSLVGLLLLAGSLLALAPNRSAALEDSGETRAAVEPYVRAVQDTQPESAQALFKTPGPQAAFEALRGAPYVAYVWVFAPDGSILSSSQPAAQGYASAEARATAETRRLLASLPAGTFTPEQRTALLAASAVQAEGEHNDVFRQMVEPLQGPSGELSGWLGVVYDVSPGVGQAGLAMVALPLAALGLALYWLALPAWVLLDARTRGERAWVWAVFVLVGNLAGLAAYLLARAPRPEAASV